MTLLNKIKQDSLTARKARDTVASNLLGTLVSEAAMVGKNAGNRDSTDEEVLKVVKKFLDNAKDTLKLVGNSNAIEQEIVILHGYMPLQLTEAQLKEIIDQLKLSNPGCTIGAVMANLKTYYEGQYDGKLASQLFREYNV